MTGPYVVPKKAVGKRLELGAPLVRMLAKELGLVERAPLDEKIAELSATAEERDAEIESLKAEIESMRLPTERYYAMMSNKTPKEQAA